MSDKITFVENALIGEDVDIEVINSKKKYNEAVVKKYHTLSKDRESVKCPYYDLCGGCDILHFKYDKELEFKKKKVQDILKKFGDIDIEIKNILESTRFNYRNKATFQVKEKIGYFKKKSYDIVKVDNCLIVGAKINELLDKIKDFNLDGISQIIIRASKNTNDTMVVIKGTKFDSRFKDLDITSLVFEDKVVKGSDYIKEKLNDNDFVISPESFFQVNVKGAEVLYNKVLEYADLNGHEKVLDLYCGTGTIGIYLSRYASDVVGVEINESSIHDALINKKINHIKNIDFICSDVKDIDIKDIDVVVVDPPRSGLDNKTINYLLNLKAKKIIYVSCDPVTLARDLKLLKEKYTLKDITLVDMFPKTEHVECVTVLNLKNA